MDSLASTFASLVCSPSRPPAVARRARQPDGGTDGSGGSGDGGTAAATVFCSDRSDRPDRAHRRHGGDRAADRDGRGPQRLLVGGRRRPSKASGASIVPDGDVDRGGDPGRPLRQPVCGARHRPGLFGVGGRHRVDGLGLRRRRRRGSASLRRALPHRRHVLGAHRRHLDEPDPLQRRRQVLAAAGRLLRRRADDDAGKRLLRLLRRPADRSRRPGSSTASRSWVSSQRHSGCSAPRARHHAASTPSSSASPPARSSTSGSTTSRSISHSLGCSRRCTLAT